MKTLRKPLFFSMLLVAALLFSACGATQATTDIESVEETVTPDDLAQTAEESSEETAEEAEASSDIVDIAVADGRFETLVQALTAADLVDTLQGEGPFTVFAPTDDAFAALPEGTVEGLLNDTPALTDVLLYHVVPGKVPSSDVVALDFAETVLGEMVSISAEDGTVMVNEAEVILTDIEASNGVIHVIDSVLLPPAEEAAEMTTEQPEMEQDIVDIAVADERFETLVQALTAADLVETLQGEGPFTVFAPTDDAFAALPEGTVEDLLADVPALTEVLLYHVVPGEVLAADVVNLDSADTVQGKALDITAKDGNVMINDAEVVITDIEASNGVIHVVDSVLLPPAEELAQMEMKKNIVDIAVEDERFETLVQALTAADLVDTLQGEGPFTVFAPTDDAFAALPEGTLDGLLADVPALTEVLLYHVVPGQVLAADVVALDSAQTVQGQPIDINVENNKVMINGAEVIITDIEASNGVIHVVDSVLLPPAETAQMNHGFANVAYQSQGAKQCSAHQQ